MNAPAPPAPTRLVAPAVRAGLPALPLALAGLALLLTALMLGVAAYRYATTGNGIGGDFLTDYAGGYIVRTGDGGRLYDLTLQETTERAVSPAEDAAGENVNPFVLPPVAAWLFAPLTLLPFRAAHLLFSLANLAALAAAVLLLRDELRAVDARLRATLLGVFALSMPTVTNISWGQVDLLLVLAMLLGWRALRSGHDAPAGVALSLALLKPHFLAGVVLLLLVQRRWRTLAVLGAIAYTALVPPALALGRDAVGEYAKLALGVTHMPEHIDAQPQHMANVRGLISSATGDYSAALWVAPAAIVAAASLVVAWRRWRDDAASPRAYALAVVLPLLVSPHVHMQSLMLLFVAIALLANSGAMAVRLPGGREVDGVTALLWLYVALFAGWFLTATALAVMVFLVAGVFAWCATAPLAGVSSARDDDAALRPAA